jgi:hypothetical protein
MRWLFILLITVLAAADILGNDMSLGPGLSPKNAVLYVIALAMFFRLALSGNQSRQRLPMLQTAFTVWLVYATLSYATCCFIVHWTAYDVKEAGMLLKSQLYDMALFCFTIFYAVQSETDFKVLLKTLVSAIGLSSILTLTDVIGLTHFGVRVGQEGAEADRVFGMFGHANETGALLVSLLPAMVAVATMSRGPARLWWYAGVLSTLAVLVLTVSRGSYVAVVLGYGAAAYVCRRFLPLSRVASWLVTGLTGALVVSILVTLIVPNVGDVIGDRLLGASTSIDMSEVSSGRTNVWMNTLQHMLDTPVSFLSGFGWNVYETRFVYATHNYYLDLWFDLGVVGVMAFITILYQAVKTASSAAVAASAEMRPFMIAVVFGVLGLAVNILFTNLSKPWPYIWMYIGMSLSIAAKIIAEKATERAAEQPILVTASPGLPRGRAPARLPSAHGAR